MNDLLLRSGINGFINRRQNLLRFIDFSFLHKIGYRTHERLHIRLEWQSACATFRGLSGTLHGGLDDRHSAGSLGERTADCKRKVEEVAMPNA